jgi:farnesyl-diphosphate farnesyltransferase
VIAGYQSLAPGFQRIIADITQRMGAGMADFSDKEIVKKSDYDLYCHYVAGLVGMGLSKLFAFSTLEGPIFNQMDELSNNMGLFLQKTNIIRDYRGTSSALPCCTACDSH